MIQYIVVTNPSGETLTMELTNPNASGFVVLGADGLGPPNADINLTEMTGFDGGLYNSSRAESRNVVLELEFRPKPTIEATRRMTYKYFPIKKNVNLRIITDDRTAETSAYVESNEPDIFVEKEGCSISLLCPSAYLFDVQPSVTKFGSIAPLFSFPFSNDDIGSPPQAADKLLVMGEYITHTIATVNYIGEAEVGLIFKIHAIGPASELRFIDNRTLESIDIDSTKLAAIVGSDIVAGDDIIISTVKGDKYARLIRSGVSYNIMNALGFDPTWFTLTKGDNVFAYTADTGLENLQFEIHNAVGYEGI